MCVTHKRDAFLPGHIINNMMLSFILLSEIIRQLRFVLKFVNLLFKYVEIYTTSNTVILNRQNHKIHNEILLD